jgi:hypothetical protein
LLFRRQRGYEIRSISSSAVRTMPARVLAHTGLTNSVTGEGLHFTPPGFRRLFITGLGPFQFRPPLIPSRRTSPECSDQP